MEQRTIKHGDHKVVVAEADVRMGMKHTLLVSEGIRRDGVEKDDLIDKLIAVYTYSACIAATIKHKGFEEWPPPFDFFVTLPESFVSDWERGAYELNPHWMPTPPDEDEDEEVKKVTARAVKPASTKVS